MSLAHIHGITHANGGKKLYENTEIRINKGEHIALIGPNGAGKTTLLNIIAGKVVPDKGNIDIHQKIKIGYLDQHQEIEPTQTVDKYLKTAFEELYELESRMNKIYEQIAIEYDEDELMKALKYQDILTANYFDTIDKRIGNLVVGLGIGLDKLDKPMGDLSGGQRGKIILAKLLLSDDDFLLLDEPTNFLDLAQVEWLAKFLQSFPKAYLMVSHDSDFINKTCGIIYNLDNFKLTRYVGNYDKFLSESEIQKEQYDKEFKSQQEKIKKLETYVAKNKARASTAKSAQSRQKQLEKMDVMNKRSELTKPKMSFLYKRPATNIVVTAENLLIGYDNSAILHELNFQLREGEKCIISGKNGIGKTTFLKTLAGEINAVGGKIELGNNVMSAYFRQVENVEDISSVVYLMRRFPNKTEQEIRSKLSQFGVKSQLMNNAMGMLSGGEQTKVRLAALSMEECSLLILDEPTNHIDVLAKEALLEAIEEFKGTVILTTHDINFSTNWANKIIDFSDLI